MDDAFQQWKKGFGVIQHQQTTQNWVRNIIDQYVNEGQDEQTLINLFIAADRITSAAMWLVVHQSYTCRVNLEGKPLQPEDFKETPQGHTGGSLNMVPAYVGYMLANAITGTTRSWVMEQGHCVAAIDSVNLILDNMLSAHAKRYDYTEKGLSAYVSDFYSYRLDEEGKQDSPLGSHVNINTAGGSLEGGYLGFAGLQYIHMPLPGENLVAFLSDGAFEEQRGSDWAARWWRAEDSGLVVPIMIFNGRRIDQRSIEAQGPGLPSFITHLENKNFDPIIFDGTDPAAFACMILEGEKLLKERGLSGKNSYPISLPYGVATSLKGAGFYGAGTNLAHSLPLGANPRDNSKARDHFNEGVRALFVPREEVLSARKSLLNHEKTNRLREREHSIANRSVRVQQPSALPYRSLEDDAIPLSCPMTAIDSTFLAYIEVNPTLRPRIGNPDEMLSNHMKKSLSHLKHRVTEVEPGIAEAIDGKVITVLNEEAVVCACLGNKGGINLVVTYEAFSPKMLGAIRQEINWSDDLIIHGREAGWVSVPIILTSHAYENGKNERSHQDTTLCEALLNESSHVSRVLFPADYNSAVASLECCYQTRGQIFTFVASKNNLPDVFTQSNAQQLLANGITQLASYSVKNPQIIITAIGSYQLQEALRAAKHLQSKDIPVSVNYMIEPGRFRSPRTSQEADIQSPEVIREEYYPEAIKRRIFVTHPRPEVIVGILRPLDTGPSTTRFLGFINQGGTLDTGGMLFVNRQTWAHIVQASAEILERELTDLLESEEIAALRHQRNPQGIIIS